MKSKEITQIYKELTERKTKIEKCSSCLWRNFCQAGCMGQVLDEKETIWDTDRFCEYRQKLYEKTFQALLKQFASHSRNEGDGHKDISDIEPECNPTL
jgi:sulfatase maturation enzyme AslB (radical SAM superfamily)